MTVGLTAGRWWLLLLTALLVITAWPPDQGRSLAMKGISWAADPTGSLPVLPEQLGFGLSDDVQAVEARDAEVRRYDDLFNSGSWMRARLRLKTAEDPFDATTERQLLLVAATVIGFVALRHRS